ncbi:unnamed protein product, partial [Meganyctiphanes norvegica]
VLSSLFLRALRISSDQYLQPELDILWASFKKLGYPDFNIREALSAAKTQFFKPISTTPTQDITDPVPTPKSRYLILPWHHRFPRLTHHLRAANYKLVYSYRDSIG